MSDLIEKQKLIMKQQGICIVHTMACWLLVVIWLTVYLEWINGCVGTAIYFGVIFGGILISMYYNFLKEKADNDG